MSNPRQRAIQVIDQRGIRKFDFLADDKGNPLKVSQYFGINTFSQKLMKEKLPKDVYQKLTDAIQMGKKLDQNTANTIAHAIKEWALENGVSHFCHWFQPQTGLTAEKHDAFLTLDDNGSPLEKFTGAQLIQSEPDASSFPSGGMRATFEARGYTAWDPSSPIFIIESTNGKTLCIPSAFISYHGDALDEKTPLLRSMDALNRNAMALLQAMGDKDVKRVVPTVGPEQEYFLIDRMFFDSRPDLVMTGRTLLGGQPPKGQQLEDHYFGSISERVLAYMQEIEFELYKLGVPVKTRHNEVAPSQYESAPIFEEANIATDHNQIVMEVMRRVAERHSFTLLLHEKPFAGINGSGKHTNWSMMAIHESGETSNLLEPGKTPHQNLRFLMVLAAVMKGVHRHAGLLRAAIATPGNDHRLGANEAPPAIISIFLGQQLAEICDKIESGTIMKGAESVMLDLGVSKIPEISKDNTDRNRTSPFAFTGNKFEFRAVGASSAISFPVTIVDTAVAEALGELAEQLKKKGKSSDSAVLEIIREAIAETKKVRFEGNNYSDEWVKEAEKRGLLNLRTAPEAIEQLLTSSSKKLLTSFKVLSEQELHSRHHIMTERYIKKVSIEAEALGQIVDTHVIPAAMKEQTMLASSIVALTSVMKNADVSEQTVRLTAVSQAVSDLLGRRKTLGTKLSRVLGSGSEEEKAHGLSTEILGLMDEVRAICDKLEGLVTDEFWPLPKYREMLFIA